MSMDHPAGKQTLSGTAEARRLAEARQGVPWRRWGPYLSERQWGTVREDYSADGNAWDYFPHDHARSRAYRWGEDGIAGFGDDQLHLCLGLALWNGRDPILKERLFGLTNAEGNHGEDVKELYYYLDATPTHSYLRMLYKYPQAAFPYALARRGEPAPRHGRAGVRAARHRRLRRRPLLRRRGRIRQGRARRHPDADHGRTTAGPRRRRCTCCRSSGSATPGRGSRASTKPQLRRTAAGDRSSSTHPRLPAMRLHLRRRARAAVLRQRNQRAAAVRAWTRRAISRTASTTTSSHGDRDAVNPDRGGTKAAAHYRLRSAGRRQRPAARCGSTPDDARRRPSTISTRSSASAAPRPTSSTPRCSRTSPIRTRGSCSARRSPACSGGSSSTTTTCPNG